ncbi:MAG: transporter ATP-binding protein [Clostridiales bacterium]|nr:transporter ATP-binding protein [Clostridiales bacterium]
MIEIGLKEIQKYYGANKILENLSFEIQTGEKIGLIGNNGTGKTTAFKIISGIENYDNGMLMIRKGASIGYLDQIPDYPKEFKVIDVLNSAFNEVHKVGIELKSLEVEMSNINNESLNSTMKKYGEKLQLFEHLGGYEIEDKINKICTGLKIYDSLRDRPFNTLSGGEKTRIVLAKILLENSDILLLDEPTNHLDMESLEWLEDFLLQYKGTVLIVSHDRYFLDRVVTRIIEVEDGEANIYHGNYTYFVDEKERRLLEQFEAFQDQQKKVKAMEKTIKMLMEWGDRGDNPKFHRKAASMQKRLDKMDKIERPTLDKAKIQLDFSGSERSGKDVISIRSLSKSFGSNVLFQNIDMGVQYGEKLAIIGKNGSGKSTLFKILLGENTQDSGEVNLGTNLKIGYLEQNVAFNDENHTVLEEFRDSFVCSEGQARRILAKFLFYGEDVFKTVKNLSGGEKSRLKLCQLMHQDINLLLLDEPTNHLDIESREMLEDALNNFIGTILFISHDRYFLNKISEKIYELKNGDLDVYLGNYDYYKQKCLEKVENKIIETIKPIVNKNFPKRQPSTPLESNKKLQEKLEVKISSIEELIKDKDIEMQNNSDNYELLDTLFKEKSELQRELDLVIEEWLTTNPE